MANNLMDKPEMQAIQVIKLGERLKEINLNIISHNRLQIEFKFADLKRDKLEKQVINTSDKIKTQKVAISKLSFI